jgi:hypothetical protein
MQLDPIRRHAGLAVKEVEEGGMKDLKTFVEAP